ncbi:MAG: hypothetical protein ABSC65_17330 [Acidobacteriaceae bacterium]|jgi:hypothetical protein
MALSLVVTFGFAKDKTKGTLPPYVLQARTVAVIIDRTANMSIDDPRANQTAQKDVEAALLKWGRFEPVSNTEAADLIVVVRRGNGRLMDDTIPDPRQNSGGINPIDHGGSIGPQRNSQPNLPTEPGLGPNQQTSQSPADMRDAEDSFTVFKGSDNPLYATPAWKYVARDGLNPQTVPAVAAFKRAIAAADKAAAQKPSEQTPPGNITQ